MILSLSITITIVTFSITIANAILSITITNFTLKLTAHSTWCCNIFHTVPSAIMPNVIVCGCFTANKILTDWSSAVQ
jgi:hypothetical protein